MHFAVVTLGFKLQARSHLNRRFNAIIKTKANIKLNPYCTGPHPFNSELCCNCEAGRVKAAKHF